MATNPQGIMALPENDQMTSPQAEMPQMTLDDSYDVVTQGLENASPEAALANKQALAQIAPQLEALPPDQLDALMRVFQYLYDHPEEYQEKVADLVANGKFEQGDFPDEYDPEFLSVVLLAIVDVRRRAQSQAPEQAMAPPPGMARGGIAEAARMAMSKGRGNDTMLAHITPKEAKMLRSKGGAGIINPATGLPEYDLWSSIRDTITAPARAVIDVAKQVVASPIGRIAATVGLAMLIGPAAFGLSGALGTAASMAVASGAVTAIGGGNISDILKSAAIGGATAFFGAPGGVVSNFVGGAVTNAAANAAISAGIVGTGVGLATGQSLQESIQSGLTAGAVSGLVTGADKGFTTDMTGAKTGVLGGENTPNQNQPPQALSPEQVQANIARQAQQTAQQTALDQSGVNQPLTGPQASMPQGAPSGAAAGQAGASGSAAAPGGYQVPGLGEGVSNMGKGIMQMMPGTEGSFSGEGGGYDQFMKGAGQVFAPSPSAQQVADYASANNMSVTEASKLMSPGLMRTYGPGIAAGLAATKVMGGFDTAPVAPSAARSDIEDRLAKERAEVANNPGKYVPQGIPGLIYNNRGEITGSEPFSSKATMDDIRVPTPEYVPRPTNVVGSNYQLPQNTFTSRTGGQSIYQPYNTSSMYSNIMPPAAYADGGYATQPPIHAFGGGFSNLLSEIRSITQPVSQQMSGGLGAVGNMVNPTPTPSSSAPVSVSETFSRNPFSTRLLPGDFAENANRIDANRASRVASAQQAYEERARAQAAAAQQAATAGSARGKRMFFDPRIGIAKSMQRADGGIANLTESKYYPRKTGHISGPGTETSDSIPAMLSDGEFVMTAKAVKALGKGNRRAGAKKMYALMHQLERNASRG